jgi:hypothetical protein
MSRTYRGRRRAERAGPPGAVIVTAALALVAMIGVPMLSVDAAWWVLWGSGALAMGAVLLVPFLPDRRPGGPR